MRQYQGKLLHAASDLIAFLGCSHAVALNLQKLRHPESLPDRAVDDESLVLIQNAGHAHEAAFLASLKLAGDVVEIDGGGSLEARTRATREAMAKGAPMIYQGAFLSTPWHGFADFMRRVAMPSALGAFSYEVIDTKLARSPSSKHVLQLALYSDLIAEMQGVQPHGMHLVLGDDREISFRTLEFKHMLDATKGRYLHFIEQGAPGSKAEPCAACSLCGWREVCATQWEAEDHLSLVAGMRKSQAQKLNAAGVTTVSALAALRPDTHIPKLAPLTLARLQAQAAMQIARRTREPMVEPLPLEEGRGFLRMPQPSSHDLFFDLEGDPLHPDGLEYLWGVHYRDKARQMQFRYQWGHDRAGERAAFEAMVDWFTEHVIRHPEAHIYHYAPYEVTVLRRLSTAFASREEAVDRLLRAEKFVDLYAITRAAVRTSEPNLSLKTLEIFFADKRAEGVKKADQSIVFYHRWREIGDQALLDAILAYNKVDCENTEGLRDWLVSLRPQAPWWTKTGAASEPENKQEAVEREIRRDSLRQAVRKEATRLSERGRELMAYLIDFHARVKKPEQWAVFDRYEKHPEELVDDGECIGDIRPAGPNWQRPDGRSIIATYRFPEQDAKLREGKDALHAPTLARLGKIVRLDRKSGIVELRRGVGIPDPWPEGGSIIPSWPLNTDVLERAVERVAEFLASDSNPCARNRKPNGVPLPEPKRYQAIVDLIERSPPRLSGWAGGDLVCQGESLIDAAAERALALDHSILFIQGPPGTGKTHTSAHVILALLKAGKRVGVSSNSHKAINNLLGKVEEIALKDGVSFFGAKKVSKTDQDSYLNGQLIEDVEANEDIEESGYQLIGGTAWLFARPNMDQRLDYLFVDEAGQVSLGHLVAMGAAARNIILVGDQMQLSQPIQGAHPGDSGLSALDYLLQGAATIAPDRGILLDTSWRMHPSIQSFISEAVYDGRLKARPDCERQRLILNAKIHPALRPQGITFIPTDHYDCSQKSDEEVALAATLVDSLIGQRFVNRQGMEGVIGLDNILIVAPYNMQVEALKAGLPDGARIGTVDKFQGQEAEVVIISLATSSPDDLPRHVDFFYSKNRLNVAISRARTLAVILANPRLLELDAQTVEHLQLVNTLAWLIDYSEN